MQTKARIPDSQQHTHERDEELVGVLLAISVVAKRLARKLTALASQEEMEQEDGNGSQ